MGLILGSVLAIVLADLVGLVFGVGLSAYFSRRQKARIGNKTNG